MGERGGEKREIRAVVNDYLNIIRYVISIKKEEEDSG